MKTKNNKLFDKQLLRESLRASVRKLAPRTMIKNPIMFTVEIVTAMMLTMLFYILLSGDTSQGTFGYNLVIFLVLLATLLFANFAEAIAEARGKAQADSLRKTREETPAKLVAGGSVQIISSSALKKNDIFECVAGDTIPADGEIIEGLASIDESAITGESAPVIREAGGDKSSVTGGTKVLSDRIRAKVTAQPGESFLDKMIALVEGASRQKTPNEIALTILLAGFTLVFVIVCATLKPFADYVGANLTIAALISLFVCLIPTTIGGLLSAIGIAGMDRALQANVITKSGRAVETAGDVDTLLLDKTGTITIGNRKATRFHPIAGTDPAQLIRTCMLSSVSDETPEGKSILELGRSQNVTINDMEIAGARMIKFTAETKCSGADLADGRRIRKGAFEAIRRIVEQAGHPFDTEVERTVKKISENGGTPLVVCENEKVTGVIELQDIIKPGIRERFDRLRRMGVKTVMVTGDNPLTAKYIAEKAGVDDFIAEAKPEDKMEYIKREQQSGKLVAMMGDGTNDAPALAQADVGVAMNSGTQAAKEAGNMVDLDNDPTKLIEIVEIGKQLLMTRGTLTTFSIANDVAKYFAIVPALFIAAIPSLEALNLMHLHSPESAILSAVIFNAIIIPLLIPLALRGVKYKPIGASALLRRN
ncbi:potassium-transporting ATPase subunit KdpB, partial [Alistipes communis]|uniref:potassium-transporting ATPase subunit KdpB n=3 Tax=Alistipes TaxID=239759 RepID=UPI003AF8F8D8